MGVGVKSNGVSDNRDRWVVDNFTGWVEWCFKLISPLVYHW